MERNVGDKFDYNGITLMVEIAKEDDVMGCDGCYFYNNMECEINCVQIHNGVGQCCDRDDNRLVIFKQVDIKPTYPMYRIATKKRKYSTTPIVRVTLDGNGNEQEDIVICVVLPKKDGDVLSNTIIELLNK